MSAIEEIGRQSTTGQALYLLKVSSPAEVPDISLCSSTFGVLVLWDITGIDPIELVNFGSKLVSAGGIYFSCWGPKCELLHDAIDWAEIDFEDDDKLILTTWNSEESLEETIWFFLNSAFLTLGDRLEPTIESVIAICVGNSEWASECRHAFHNPEKFSDRVLENNESAV